MKPKDERPSGVHELCRRLKIQLDELAVEMAPTLPVEEQTRRSQLMEQLKRQLAELSN